MAKGAEVHEMGYPTPKFMGSVVSLSDRLLDGFPAFDALN